MTTSYKVIGIMSGTSLDGLDLAYCLFSKQGNKWQFQIPHAETIPYDPKWRKRLNELPQASALDFAKTHVDFGRYIGDEANKFIEKFNLKVDFISSHGHTIFHQPENGFTAQIGDGASIAAKTSLDIICDFRSVDIALGGQGAPLVPIGDFYLFSDYNFRLNLGGFANISFEEDGKTFAFDIAPANLALNHFAQKTGLDYDKNGEMASKGNLIPEMFNLLNQLSFYKKKGAKSLGREFFESEFLPLIDTSYAVQDILNTLVQHIAFQISNVISGTKNQKLLITGGGAYNLFLIEKIREYTDIEVVIPSSEIIEYKEALIFAFLGILRTEKKINTLKEVTGANKDSVGGAIYKG